MRTTTVALASLSTVALFLVTACGSTGADDPADSTVSVTTTAPAVTETTMGSPAPDTETDAETDTDVVKPRPTLPPETGTAAPLPPLGEPNMGQKSQSPEGSFDMSVAGVRVAEHETFTRVVFDIGGSGSPGWWTDYQNEPVQQASGLPVELAGDSFLEVSIDGIALPTEAAEPGVEMGSFDGAGIVQEVKLTTVFEARAQFFIGISGGYRDYSVTRLDDPSRLVVDIIHQ